MVATIQSKALIETWENKTNYQRFCLTCPKCGNKINFDNNEYVQGMFNTDIVLSSEIAVISFTCYFCKETMDFNLSKFHISQEQSMSIFLANKDFILGKIFDDSEFMRELNQLFYTKINVPSDEMKESVELLVENFDTNEYEKFNNKTKEELVLYGMQVLQKYIKRILIDENTINK